MYYPYFRGRQNELLCLKELLENGKLSEKIVPILEPVRFNSTFFNTLKKFIEYNRHIIVIRNPKVGKFNKEFHDMLKKIEDEDKEEKKEKLKKTIEEYKKIINDEHILVGYIANSDSIKKILEFPPEKKEKIYLINERKGDYGFYADHGKDLNVKASFIPKDENFKDEVTGNVIILEDCYHKEKRNVDYIADPDVFFSINHVGFDSKGYQGFSDYSIIGNEYEESGFAPLAIAIHIVYFGMKKDLRVHHFVSDSNENISDPARKFAEAMEKLVHWENIDAVNHTMGLKGLIQYYEAGRFPGLGVIKKFSIMHHIELMGEFLEGEK